MVSSDFEFLLCLAGPKIEKQNANLILAISAGERLLLTLRFLATGDSSTSLQYLARDRSFRIIGRVRLDRFRGRE